MTSAEEYHEYIGIKSLFYFCSLPLRLDSYHGCEHGCLYCFSRKLNNRKSGFYNRAVPANPDKFVRLMGSVNSRKGNVSLITSFLQRKVPIHFGCVSDPFQPQEKKSKVSLVFLRTLQEMNYPVVISTKSDLILMKDYISVLKKMSVSIQISFSTFNNDIAKKIEPNVPSPTKRLQILRILSQMGFYTVARLQPFLYPFEQIDSKTFEQLANAGVKHVVLEHLRIPTNSSLISRKKLWNVLGMNMIEKYKELGIRNSRISYELNSDRKLNNIVRAKKYINQFGMTFGSGDNEFHHISDQYCCCGIPNSPEFNKVYKGNIGYAIFTGIRRNKIAFSCLNNQWQPNGSIQEYLNSHCRLIKKGNIVDMLKLKIDNPNTSNSPSSFYGIDYLENKNKYIINKSFVDILKTDGGRKCFLKK
jgi:DNA repair photolyase